MRSVRPGLILVNIHEGCCGGDWHVSCPFDGLCLILTGIARELLALDRRVMEYEIPVDDIVRPC